MNQILEKEKEEVSDVINFKLQLANKIQKIGNFSDVLLKMRENQEKLLEFKNIGLDGKLPRNKLLETRSSIKFD